MSEKELEDKQIRELEQKFLLFKKKLKKEGVAAELYITVCLYEAIRVIKKYHKKTEFITMMSDLYDNTKEVS
jgi:hypothetical protein